MKNTATLCMIFLFCALNSLAQTPASTPSPAMSELSKLQTNYDPESGLSPLTLLSVPKDGVHYYEIKMQARQFFDAKKFAEAEPLLERLVREYPRDPENWTLLADTKANLNKPQEAALANEQVGKLFGWDMDFYAGYKIAKNYLAIGDKRGALAKLRQMIFERHGILRTALYNDPAYTTLRDNPEFLELIGRPDTTGWSREKGWTYDLDFLYSELKRVDPEYRDKPLPKELTRRYEELKRNIPQLSDEEIYIEMSRMLAVLHQGHTQIYNVTSNRFLPIQLYVFPDGVYIINAADEYKNLIGLRVIAFGNLPAEEAARKYAETLSVDGDMEYVWQAAYLVSASHLKSFGVIKSVDSVPLTLQKRDSPPTTVTLPTIPRMFTPRLDRLVAPPAVEPPLYLSQVQKTLWETALPENDALYVQVNNIRDDKDITLSQFGQNLWTQIEKTKPKNIILDLRHNHGGTTQKYPELLRTLIAFSRFQHNQLYVLIGRRTYSAAGNLVTDLERLTAPIFVGEATSECCNLYGDATLFRLPFSKLEGLLSTYKWQLSYPGDRRREMSPQVPVQLTAEAYFKGQDPAMDAVFRLIAAKKRTDKQPQK